MNAKRLLLSSLLGCTLLALTIRLLTKSASAEQVTHSASYDAIDAYVEQRMGDLNIPGVSLAIVEGSQIGHLRNFGRAWPSGEPPSAQTPFVLGSTTKSFTALAVMQLVEAGKIDLDAPVQRYLPWFRIADSEASAQMTVRHLLNQTSGLPELPGLNLLADFDASPGATERQARTLSALRLTRPVGSEFEYSNLNYNLLGLVVEAGSEESYADYIQNHIFSPLGMNHSYTTQTDAKRNGLAMGHRYWFGIPFAEPNLAIPHGSVPSGQLISSSQDMANYLIANLNGGRYGNLQILSPSGFDELHRGAAEYVHMGISVGEYGMGWFISDMGPATIIWHTGTAADFSSYMALLPEQKKGVVLLINADHYWMNPVFTDFGMSVAALLAGQQPAAMPFGFIPWVLRALMLVPLLQIVDVVTTLWRLRGWRREPEDRPRRGRAWVLHILLPLVPNLSLAAVPIFLQVNGMLRYTMVLMPDIAWIALICGSFAGLWSLLRTRLILQALGEPSMRKTFVGRPNTA